MFSPTQQKNSILNIYKSQIEHLEINVRQLEEETIQLRKDNSEMNIIIQNLKYENLGLLKNVISLERKNQEIIQDIRCLKMENSILKSEKIKLLKSLQCIQIENTKLLKIQRDLKEEKMQLQESLERIDQQNQKILSLYNDLNQKFEDIYSNKFTNELLLTNNQFLNSHYQNTIKNDHRKKNYYPEQLQEIYTIISFVGRSWYSILKQIFDLPEYRTVQRYRKKYLEIFGFSRDIFDGKKSHLIKLLSMFGNQDSRYVISIDAVSLESYVSISADGDVQGLKITKSISKNQAQEIINDNNIFERFIQEFKDQIENYVYVIYLCALNPNAKSFPIVLIPDVIGNCTQATLNKLLKTKDKLIKLGVDIIGTSFDGDLKYFDLLNPIYEKIINFDNYNFDLPFCKISFYQPHNYLFSDPLHLLKCVRYRYVNEISKFCFFTDNTPTITLESFISIGIPHYLLDPHKSKKMEDSFPKDLFKFKFLSASRLNNRMDLYFALFPFVMLCESIFNEELSIDNRYLCLERGFCFILIYSICMEHYFDLKKNAKSKNEKYRFIQQMKKSKKCVGITLIDKRTCVKYLTLVASLLIQIYQNKETSIGAFGTHYTEHFFSKLRRISHGDNRSDAFFWSLLSDLIFEELSKKNSINITVPKRVSSSGVLLKPQNAPKLSPFKKSMQAVLNMFNKFLSFSEYKQLFSFISDNNEEYYFFEDDLVECNKPNVFISTRKTSMVATGGLNPLTKYVSHKQIRDLANSSQQPTFNLQQLAFTDQHIPSTDE